jgi:hypothetical protein
VIERADVQLIDARLALLELTLGFALIVVR